jgi:hypothetical protein
MFKRALSGFVLYLLSGALAAYAGQFLEAPQYPTGTNPRAVAVGDFNGDGNLDVAIVNSSSNTISVLLGKGDGTFAPQVVYTTGTAPQGIAVGYFDGNDYLDIAVTNSGSNTVSVFLGNGDGTFQPKVDYATGNQPQGIAIVDLTANGGNVDIVVANATDGTVGMLLGNGNGTFNAQVPYRTGFNPWAVVVGDFNNDGIPDLAVANNNTNNVVSVLLGNANGTFQSQLQCATGNTPVAIAVADFNGDGNLDMAVADQQGNAVSILLGNGKGGFATHVDYPTAYFPTAVTVGDFNGDGKLDLAVSAGNGNAISVLWGVGDGTFQGQVNVGTGDIPYSVVTGDFNNDGKTDVAVANSGSNTISVILNNGNETFQARTDYAAGTNPHAVATADFNGDGFLDLAVANSNCPAFPSCGPGTISIILGNGDGTFQAPANYSTGTDTDPYALAVGDFNGDNIPDLAVANYATNTVSLMLGAGDGTFGSPVAFPVESEPASVATGDFTADGNLDLVVANFHSNTVSVLLGNGKGTFQSAVNYNVGHGPVSVAVGDFNGDQKLDLVVVNETDNNASVLLGNGDGTFQPQVAYPTGVGGNPLSVVVGDFNGDGNLDLAAADFTTQQVSVLLGNGDGTFQTVKAYPTGANPSSIIIADFNGDGKLDLALTSTPLGSAPGNQVSLLLGNGDGTFGLPTLFGTGSEAYSAAVGDFNEDGAADMAVANGASNTVSVLLNTQGTAMSIHSSANPSTFGQSVTLSVTVAASVSNGAAPTGTVTLENGNTVLGSGALVNGQFSLSTTALPVGADTLSAIYSGDSNYQPHTVTLIQTVQIAGSRTALASSANPSSPNQLITFTATVSSNTTGQPTGTVTFVDGVTTIGSSPLNGSGIAAFSTSTLSVGTHSITATYGGNASFSSSTSPVLSQVVQQGNTSTALLSSANPSSNGQSVTLTATVSSGTGITPTGTIKFMDGTTALGTSTLNGSGVATFSTSTLSVGTNSLTAVYSGDSNSDPSTSPVLSQVVQKDNTNIALTSSPNPSTFEQPLTISAAVTSSATGAPTGTVTFLSGTATLGISSLNASGVATLSIATLTAGADSLTAVYSGDTNFATSTSPVLSQVVQKAITTTSLSSSPTSANLNQPVTFTATVTPGTAGVPTGTLVFLDGTTQLGSSALSASGFATFSTSALTAGTHSITAAYSGDGNFMASTSTAESLPVTSPGFSLSATALSPSSVAPGASAQSNVTISNPVGGLNPSTVALACTVSPSRSPAVTCSLGTISVANNAGTSVLTVATSGAQAALTPAADKGLGMLFLSGLIIPAILLGGTGRNTPGRRKLLAVCLVFLVLGGCLLQVACGSSGSGNPSTPGNSGTPAGVYTVTITGNASGTSQQTTSVSLTVQ